MMSPGWQASAFWPQGGHLCCIKLHLVGEFGLGGTEANPVSLEPFSASAKCLLYFLRVTSGNIHMAMTIKGARKRIA
jgi:hypothetical protein